MNAILSVLRPILSIAISCFFLYIAWTSYVATRNMSAWPVTQGTISKSSLKPSGGTLIPDFEYQYSVSGIEYQGYHITNPPDAIEDVEFVKALLEEYPVGRTVDVFFNPEIPRVAVLEKEAPVPNWFASILVTGIALAFLIVGFAYLLPMFQ